MTPRISRVWAFFTKKDGYMATCSACHRDYSYRASVSNLSKHWRNQHAKPNDLSDSNSDDSDGEQEKNDTISKPTATWNFFKVIDSEKYEATCKICDQTVPYESVSELRRHVEDHGEVPKDSDDEYVPDIQERKLIMKYGQESRRYSKLWKYFKIVDEKSATCLVCHGLFNYASTITNLRRHLMKKHGEVDLSQDDDGKKMIVSANGQLYEVETEPGHEENDLNDDDDGPMEMDTIYLEDLDESTDHLTTTSPKKKQPKLSFTREYSNKDNSKDQFKRVFPKEQSKKNRDTCSEYSEKLKRNRDTRDNYSEYFEHSKPRARPQTPSYTSNSMGSIDYFGQYIVSLLKELPKAVSDQLQNDIINQILTTKMASQTKTAAAKFELSVSRNNENEVPVPEPVSFTVVSNEDSDKTHEIVHQQE